MKKVISASRRTDLVAFFPEWTASVFEKKEAAVHGPSGHTYTVRLDPNVVHSVVLWSKNFANLIESHSNLGTVLQEYDQLYCHFTITGLGNSFIERGVPSYQESVAQLADLVEFVGSPERITIRFDPIVNWREGDEVCTNLYLFEKMAPVFHKNKIKTVRISFAQWYKKAVRRAKKHGFQYVDLPLEQKLEGARALVRVAEQWGIDLFCCSQDFLTEVPGIRASSCIDGQLLQSLHPGREGVSTKKDRTQRAECRCTESVDIGSYTQFCPHSCIYCYANPKT
jgi:hypothetical protein